MRNFSAGEKGALHIAVQKAHILTKSGVDRQKEENSHGFDLHTVGSDSIRHWYFDASKAAEEERKALHPC